jgi:diaminopimelate decarboxylase
LESLRRGARTPFYLFASEPVADRIAELEALDFGRPARHWLSCKTQPLPALLRWWRTTGRPIEVVSEFEFRMARAAGFDEILVNGPAKHRWLPAVAHRGLRVNFDSPTELAALLPLARRQGWKTGLRILTGEEFDPAEPTQPTQFGFAPDEVAPAIATLRRAGIEPAVAHFHLRTNIARPTIYRRAIREVLAICRAAGWEPPILDIGGGLPPRHTRDPDGRPYDLGFEPKNFAAAIRRELESAEWIREVWLENGRFISAGAGVLVVRVLDIKHRRGLRQLICDGGRTMNALVSTWERHALVPLEKRRGPTVDTVAYGPTCMAFDQFGRGPLPGSLRAGDHLLWLEAGAYHLPWETRFSHGLAEVWWEADGQLDRVRPAESFSRFVAGWEMSRPRTRTPAATRRSIRP